MNYYDEEGNIILAECENCKRIMKFRKHQLEYHEKQNAYYLPEPVECFCENVSDIIENVPDQNAIQAMQAQNIPAPLDPLIGIPRCPTCGSARVRRITTGAKLIGGFMFGLFSSDVRNSYYCENCKCKW